MPANDSNTDILLQLKAKLSSFRPSEKRVAEYIIEKPEDIIYLSITNIAEHCSVSGTSVIRLCKQLGCEGFQELKIKLARSMQDITKELHSEIDIDDSTAGMIKKVMRSNISAIEDTMEMLDVEEVEKAINAISCANRLEFYGLGGSGPVAEDAQHKFFKYGISCIAYSDPHMQAMSAATMKKGDVVIALSKSGRTKELIENIKIASNTGATIICITGGFNSSITRISDIILMAVSREQSYNPEPMSSRIAQLSVIDVLSVGVALKQKDFMLENLQKTRKAILQKRLTK